MVEGLDVGMPDGPQVSEVRWKFLDVAPEERQVPARFSPGGRSVTSLDSTGRCAPAAISISPCLPGIPRSPPTPAPSYPHYYQADYLQHALQSVSRRD